MKSALIGALIFSMFAMVQVLPHFATYKFGPNIAGVGSDSYGFLYSMWVYSQPADGVTRTDNRDLLSGYPAGKPIANHIQLASGLAYQLAGIGLPPVAAYNLMVWLSFFLAYFLAFQIARSLQISNGVAHLAALIIGLNPYQSLQSVDHVDLAMTWPVLLDIYLLVQLLLYRRQWAFPVLIALTGLSVFVHPYYLIFMLFINALPLLWFVIQKGKNKKRATPAFIGAIAGSIAICAGSVLFWKSLFSDLGGLATVERSIQHLYVYSTKIWDLILPPHFSALFSSLTTHFKTEQTMNTGSNFVENTLYPGLLVLFAIMLFFGWAAMNRERLLRWVKENRALTFLLANLVIVPILFSLSPSYNLFGFEISTPTQFVHKFLPQFRTMSRLAYVSSVGMILIFALLINSRWRHRGLLFALGAFFIIDLGYFHKSFYSDTGKVPEVYSYIKDTLPPKAVIFEVPFMWGYLTNYWQSYHRHPNHAAFDPGDAGFSTLVQTNQMDLGGLLSYCRANKIDYLVLHSMQALNISFKHFENNPDDTWLFFLFGRHSYVIPVASAGN